MGVPVSGGLQSFGGSGGLQGYGYPVPKGPLHGITGPPVPITGRPDVGNLAFIGWQDMVNNLLSYGGFGSEGERGITAADFSGYFGNQERNRADSLAGYGGGNAQQLSHPFYLY